MQERSKNNIEVAKNRAKLIQKRQKNSCTHSKIYNFNPYTNINKLFLILRSCWKKIKKNECSSIKNTPNNSTCAGSLKKYNG
jgi:hypothetical protein